MKILINPRYKIYSPFVKQIPEIFASQGETIYKARNEIKIFDVDGEQINVKQYKVPLFINRVIYSFFRTPKAIRAFEYADKLANLGIKTATPIAYIMQNKHGLLSQSYFISKQLDGSTMYEVGKMPLEQTKDIYKAVAIYLAKLHDKGIYHEDFSPGNVLYEKTSDGYDFSLIDINRMSFGAISLDKGCKNFARIWGNTDAFRLMARSYAEARNADIAYCTELILKYREHFWRRYRRRHPVEFPY